MIKKVVIIILSILPELPRRRISFLMLCPAYSGIRLKLLNQINTENRHVTNELLSISLMTGNQIISHTAEFISNPNDIRDLLLKNTYNLA